MKQINEQTVLFTLLRVHLSGFIAKAFQVVSPGEPFVYNWHIDVLADYLMRVQQGKIKRLLITLPPRSLKSICVSVAFVAWVLGKDPTKRIINVSYGNELSAKLARDTRAVLESAWYRQVFPQTQLIRSAELDLETSQRGMRYATSVGGALTGRGGNLLIIDDPAKPQEALSKGKREALKHWFDGTLYSRLDHKANDAIILVMQRLHVDDLASYVSGKEQWVHLNLPAIAETAQRFDLTDGRQIIRPAGSVLHEGREPKPVLDNIRSMLGSYNFSAQYQQEPVPEEGNMVKWEWFQPYDTTPGLAPGDWIVQSWDTANTVTELSDYSVCTTWLVKGSFYYLIDVFRARLDFPGLRHAVITQARQYPVRIILMEDSASGTALIQELRYHTQARVPPPIGVKPQGEKELRLFTQSTVIEAGRVFLPSKASWLEEFRSELLAFPQSRYDDQVDSLSQFLAWITDRQRRRIPQGRVIGMY